MMSESALFAVRRGAGPVGPPHAGGSALLVVVLFLLLATLFVVFALNVGRFEQRTSGNDLRAKIVHEVAESGISLAAEYLNARKGTIFSTDDNWRPCGNTETAFPCGAVPLDRRSTMYTFKTTGSAGSTLADRLIPLPATTAGDTAGGFAATREVSAVLCRVSAIPTGGVGSPTECATSLSEASSTWVITLVSKGSLPVEGSSSTVTQTIAAYNIFNLSPNVPPLIAAGSVKVGGGLQIVTSPNAAGPGVPTSVWTRLDVDTNGTPNTCYMDEFLREGGSSSAPRYYDDVMVCDTCSCPASGSLSYPKGGQFCEGPDIVDIEGSGSAYDLASYNAYDKNDATCPNAANLSIHREEFPADLFALLFGKAAWVDVNTGGGSPCARDALDCHFNEVRIIEPACTYPDPATGTERTASLPADTCYLLNIKQSSIIHIGDGLNDAAECAALGINTSGVVWIHKQPLAGTGMPGYDCETTLKNLDDIGRPSAPVALIHDGSLLQVHFKLYGLLFVREPNASLTLDPATGGSAEFKLNAGAVIYGAAVVQGEITAGGGGTAAIVHSKDVLFNLLNDDNNITPASLPGSWTDRLRY